jgi:hypothetical protein
MKTIEKYPRKRRAALMFFAATALLVGIGSAVLIAEPGLDTGLPSSSVVLEALAALTPEQPADLVYDAERGELVVFHGPVDLPGASGADMSGGDMHAAHGSGEAVFPDVTEVTIPVDGYYYGIYVDLTDREGRILPSELLHHVNLVDPDQRELFAPIALRLAAAGSETGLKGFPPRLFGVPVTRGQRVVIHTMLHNSTAEDYEGVVLRFHLRFTPKEASGPVFAVYPFWVDVRLPAGDKTFDLPPGRSPQSYEGRAAVSGKILALTGHAHTMATRLKFEDVTTNKTLWEAIPELDDAGNLIGIPNGRPFLHLGEPIDAEHTYRLTVDYDNDTGETIHDGGMGSIGGIFLPSGGEAWPTVDPTNELYQLDMKHYFREYLGKLADLREAAASG